MNKHLKGLGKDSIVLAGTGIGLGVLSGLDSSGATAKLTSGIPPIANIVVAKAGIGILSDMNKDIKKKMRY